MEVVVSPARRIRGVINVPGDKSISHRAAIFNSIADGTAEIRNFLQGEDCLSTVECMRALGAELLLDEAGTLRVKGVGLRGLREPANVLDSGNSGTTMRLLAGLLAGQPFFSVLTGDESLRRRPMGRVLEPLRAMGATCLARDRDYAPIAILGGGLFGCTYRTPVASAQVKSSLILAALYADSASTIIEPMTSRDHTERMLRAMGAHVMADGTTIHVSPAESLNPVDLRVPGDISAAAFWMVLAAAHRDAEITLPAVGVNPTRTGVIDALRSMGAAVEVTEERVWGGEPVADIRVRSSPLTGVELSGPTVLSAMDEVPVLAVAAALANGRTVIRDAEELRVKESDRIATVIEGLRRMGVEAEERPDGMVIEGRGRLSGALLESEGDHRLAMAWAVAGLTAQGETTVAGAEAVEISYPSFWRDLGLLGGEARAAP
ncbi:MAG TPA: 3-phosphoshikimate 1-carboxyvinyltransferase [Dehalococcoidia bacterium]|nr:3-phosphoshikimate 1-carboxyvinyltransferase [Dehalococcoidia bacterium]